MERSQKKGRKIVILLILLFFCLLCLMLGMQFLIKDNEGNSNNITTAVSENNKTIEDVVKKYNSEYIEQVNNKVYVKFEKDLYDQDGKSNEKYFEEMSNELSEFFEGQSFYIIDEEKNIEINNKFDTKTKEQKILINEIEDFFNKTDGNSYADVENSKIVEPSRIIIENGFLETLIVRDMFLSSIEKYLSGAKELDNGYVSYNEDKLEIKIAPNKSVMNMVFTKNYNGSLLNDVDRGDSLSEVYEKHPDNSFGSVSDGYLGYRNGNLYYFFYEDEASMYGYLYSENEKFEELLVAYIEDKNLDNFITQLSKKILLYDTFEYDKDKENVTMIFPTIGIEIKIKNNNPIGIKLYSNYYFTDTTKDLVKKGLISYSTEDLVAKYESQRRESR